MVLYDNFLEVELIRFIKDIDSKIGDEALTNTARRWINAIREMTAGYDESPKEILSKEFDEKASSMIVDREIPFWSLCKHHILPFGGHISLAYIPDGGIVGLSKLSRLVDCFARRFQVQEVLGEQIADAIADNLQAKGVMVVIDAQHICACARGVKKDNIMTTSAIRGEFTKPEVRAEFLSLIRRNGK